jgi:hypothetical protein
MPQGDKSSYTDKQKRQAKHIEDSAKKSGKSTKRAEQIAYATVNKQSGGGKKSGSGRGKTESKASSRKGGKKAAKTTSHAARSRAAKKAARTREQRAS